MTEPDPPGIPVVHHRPISRSRFLAAADAAATVTSLTTLEEERIVIQGRESNE